MRRSGIGLAIVAVYLILSFLSFGAINANVRHQDWYCGYPSARQNSSMAMLFALMPGAGEVIAVFTTGFFEYGFDWRMDCPKRNPAK